MDLETIKTIFGILISLVTILTFIGTIHNFLANRFAFNKLITNDLHHVNESIQELVIEQKTIRSKVSDLAEDVSYLKGKFSDTRKSKFKKLNKG